MPAEAMPLLYENVFGVSETKTVFAAYALTVTVKDIITRKPVTDATVTVDTYTATTDETGTAMFETLPPGTYTVEITHPSYLTKTFSLTITEAGEAKEVSLIPIWGIGLGVVGGGILVTVVATKALGWW